MISSIFRVIAMLGNEASKLTLKDVTRKCSVPTTHVYSGKQIDKIAQGKIERSVQVLLYFIIKQLQIRFCACHYLLKS
jgi:hypothetical protein